MRERERGADETGEEEEEEEEEGRETHGDRRMDRNRVVYGDLDRSPSIILIL